MEFDTLSDALAQELSQTDLRRLAQAQKELTALYQQQPPRLTHLQRQAYLATRMPATFAAISSVLRAVAQRIPSLQIRSLLDLGAGPGSAAWAACELIPSLERIQMIERDEGFIEIGKRLAQKSSFPALQQAHWKLGNLPQTELPASFQVILLSYSIGELPSTELLSFAEACWKAAQELLIIIEPGTPAGFERIRAIRSQILRQGAYPVAPCPHALECPVQGTNWCHFSQRLDRSRIHRQLKEGALGYEDEKFSYIVFSKAPVDMENISRVVRHPLIRPGHIQFSLCTPTGKWEEKIVTKKSGLFYKQAKKCHWGDLYRNPELNLE